MENIRGKESGQDDCTAQQQMPAEAGDHKHVFYDASWLFKKGSDTEQNKQIDNRKTTMSVENSHRSERNPKKKNTNVMYMMVRDDTLQNNPEAGSVHQNAATVSCGGGGRTRCNICQITQLKTIISVIHLPGIHCLQRTSLSPRGP